MSKNHIANLNPRNSSSITHKKVFIASLFLITFYSFTLLPNNNPDSGIKTTTNNLFFNPTKCENGEWIIEFNLNQTSTIETQLKDRDGRILETFEEGIMYPGKNSLLLPTTNQKECILQLFINGKLAYFKQL